MTAFVVQLLMVSCLAYLLLEREFSRLRAQRRLAAFMALAQQLAPAFKQMREQMRAMGMDAELAGTRMKAFGVSMRVATGEVLDD